MIITVSNQKGGVSKTTTTGTLAAAMSDMGYEVLAVDMDPQGNLTEMLIGPEAIEKTVYDVLLKKCKADEAIWHTECRVDLLPSNLYLAEAETELSAKIGKELFLSQALQEIKDRYDFIIIDTPPSLSNLTINALVTSDGVLIPTLADKFAVDGITQLYNTIKQVKCYFNPDLKIIGILLTQYNDRFNVSNAWKSVLEDISAELDDAHIFSACIRTSVAMREAQSKHTTIFRYKNKSTVAEDYKAFADEFITTIDRRDQ